MLLEKKEIEVEGKQFYISKFPAWSGREIVTQYPVTGLPKMGDYNSNAEIALKLMGFVEAITPNGTIGLTTVALINNHVPSWEAQLKLEWAMMEYNCSFFRDGRLSTSLSALSQKLPAWILKILTAFLQQLSPKEKQL